MSQRDTDAQEYGYFLGNLALVMASLGLDSFKETYLEIIPTLLNLVTLYSPLDTEDADKVTGK